MGRRDRPLDESTGPLHQFAAALRVLREKAGTPTYTKMARASGKSRTALAEAAGGDHVPTWPTVEAYVLACGGDPDAWLVRWEQLREHPRVTPARAVVPGRGTAPVEVPDGPGTGVLPRRWVRSRRTTVLVAVAALAVVGGSVAVSLSGAPRAPAAAAVLPAGTVAVTVQNKVALGADLLSEDRTPAYLSARTLASCKSLGCAVPGTDHLSGDVLEASCTATGDQMTNRDVEDPASAANPGSASSSRWYGVPTTDGTIGYVSEVYLAPASRGGLGLPTCAG